MVNPNCSNDLDRKKYRYKNIDYDILIGINVETFVFSFFIDFLPTFGPSFLHFYGIGTTERNTCFGKRFSALPFYRGRVLVSLKTEIDDSETISGISTQTELAVPIIEVCTDCTFHIRLISSTSCLKLAKFLNFLFCNL